MGKAPSFQFYVKDWLCDPELRLASVLSRGAWIDCLCFMWENSQRGKLTATPLKFARLISGSLDEALHFLNDMNDYEFGDIEVPLGVTFPLTEHECNVKVTITNRRMYADYKNKQNTRLRVKKHREKIDVTQKKQKCNANVTPSSPSSSSSSTPNKDIVFFLNENAKTNYRHTTPKTQKLIRARYNEGFTLPDFKTVITKKCSDWFGTDMEKYLRPETLFGTKFEGYLNESDEDKDGLARFLQRHQDTG